MKYNFFGCEHKWINLLAATPGAKLPWCLAPLILEHLEVVEQWQGCLPSNPKILLLPMPCPSFRFRTRCSLFQLPQLGFCSPFSVWDPVMQRDFRKSSVTSTPSFHWRYLPPPCLRAHSCQLCLPFLYFLMNEWAPPWGPSLCRWTGVQYPAAERWVLFHVETLTACVY